MTTRAALAALGRFEVFWDPWQITSGFGNWSTRASCAKWEYTLGQGCFGFLSDSPLTSPYLVEHVRGDSALAAPTDLPCAKAQLVRLIELIARRYVEAQWSAEHDGRNPQAAGLYRMVLRRLSGGTQSAWQTIDGVGG